MIFTTYFDWDVFEFFSKKKYKMLFMMKPVITVIIILSIFQIFQNNNKSITLSQ